MRYTPRFGNVEAMRIPFDTFPRDLSTWADLCVWLGEGPWEINDQMGVTFKLANRTLVAQPGDWIVRHDNGDISIVPDIGFNVIYDR